MPSGLRERVLDACFDRYDGQFASREAANNKLDGELIQHAPELRTEVVDNMSEVVCRFNPDFVAGVPEGAIWLAEAIAQQCGLKHARLRRSKADRTLMEYVDSAEIDLSTLVRGVLVEDVFNWFTNTRRALAVPEIGGRIVAVVAVWDRGLPHIRKPIDVVHHALITEHIPAQLPPNSAYWRHVK